MKFTLLAAAALFAGSAYAQSISACIIQCSTNAAASAGCTSYTDVSCVCTSSAFQNAAGACLIANCTTAEQQSAVQLQAALCAGQSASGSVSVRLSSATGSTALPSGSALSSLASSISASATSRPASSSGSAASASASGSGNVASSASSVLASASSSRAAGDKVAELKMGAMAVAGLVGVVGMAVGGLAVL